MDLGAVRFNTLGSWPLSPECGGLTAGSRGPEDFAMTIGGPRIHTGPGHFFVVAFLTPLTELRTNLPGQGWQRFSPNRATNSKKPGTMPTLRCKTTPSKSERMETCFDVIHNF